MGALRRALDRLKTTRAWSAWQRYGSANGDLLAAGVAYFAFFSIFPALALAFAIFGFVLQGRPDMIATIADSLDEVLPGMVKTAENPDGIITLTAPASLTLTITGIIAFVTLLLAGLGWVGALRTGIRTVFGLKASTGNAVTTKLRDLGVLTVLGVLIAVSAILSSAVGGLAGTIAERVGLPGGAALVGVVGLLAGIVFDTLIMVVLLRLLTGAPLPWRNVRRGALLGGTVIAVMKLFSGFLIGHATANPLLSAVAIPVGLLFWLNLMSRVVLLASSWAAGDVDLATLVRRGPPHRPRDRCPAALPRAAAGHRRHHPAAVCRLDDCRRSALRVAGLLERQCRAPPRQSGRSGRVLPGGRSPRHRGGRRRGGCRSRGRRSLAPPPTVTGAQVLGASHLEKRGPNSSGQMPHDVVLQQSQGTVLERVAPRAPGAVYNAGSVVFRGVMDVDERGTHSPDRALMRFDPILEGVRVRGMANEGRRRDGPVDRRHQLASAQQEELVAEAVVEREAALHLNGLAESAGFPGERRP